VGRLFRNDGLLKIGVKDLFVHLAGKSILRILEYWWFVWRSGSKNS